MSGDMTTPRVVVTRPRGPTAGAESLVSKLRSLGFNPSLFSAQVVRTLALLPDDEKRFRDFFMQEAPCVAVLSPTSVYTFKDVLGRMSLAAIAPAIRFASQGPGTTQAIKECFGIVPFFEASVSTAEGCAEELLRFSTVPHSILIPQSAIGREAVGPLLRAGGVSVLEVATYSLFTERPGAEEQRALREAASLNGYILFMSSSAVRSTVESIEDRADLERLKVISIGPTTSETVRESGLTVTEEASAHTEEGILHALQRAASRR